MQGSSTGQDQRNKLGNQCEINREEEDINIGAGFTQFLEENSNQSNNLLSFPDFFVSLSFQWFLNL